MGKPAVLFVWMLLSASACMALPAADARRNAERYLDSALREYRRAVIAAPGDRALAERYRRLTDAVRGPAAAAVETALLQAELGRNDEAAKILGALDTAGRAEALAYLSKRPAAGTAERAAAARVRTILAPAGTAPVKPPEPPRETVVSETGLDIRPFTYLVVSKKAGQISVCRYEGGKVSVVERFPCTTGKNHGPKLKQGDGRTPEGTYRVMPRVVNRKLPEKFGIAVFPLNYPNTIDRRLGKNGDGIWIHGTPIERPPYNSEGCVVLRDRDLARLIPHLEPGRMMVHIGETPQAAPPADVPAAIAAWKAAWESLDVERYLACYDESFAGDGKNKKQWAEHKRRVARGRSYIRIGLSDVRFLQYGRTAFGEVAVAAFGQRYESNSLNSSSSKVLYLVKRGSSWKILGEEVL